MALDLGPGKGADDAALGPFYTSDNHFIRQLQVKFIFGKIYVKMQQIKSTTC